ncbi:FecR family protein [Sphingobacterium griseoflavum]|uniref:Anti-sigma factor n=1 Tax=Sphingobacterium griseoflavum TaxID=1474952 RepID=A0ABQ3HZM4_9SPHI|nr:FecR family protein [Sphingobacterium griseoflavum]GHE48040.1 hypothetical protein GCM10017764_33870 [Sphingobacterium griseoflavum]
MKDWQNDENPHSEEFSKEKIIIREHFTRKFGHPEVENELDKFHNKRRLSAHKMPKVWIGAAATLLLAISTYLFTLPTERTASEHRKLVYSERSVNSDVLLQSGDRDAVVVGNKNNYPQVDKETYPQLLTGGLSYLHVKDRVISKEIITVPSGKIFKIVLQDGTEVWLNAQTKFTFPNRFDEGARRVELEGEAYFRVSKDPQRPFIVKANNLETSVIGTEFNIKNGYDKQSSVTLLKGKVQVTNTLNAESELLAPGDELISRPGVPLKIHKIDTDDYYSWHEGYFHFDDVAFSEVLREIGRWYNLDVIFENPKAKGVKLRFTADRDEDKNVIIELLNDLNMAKIAIEGTSIVVR